MVDESLIVGSGLRCHSLNMIVHQPILLPGSASGNTERNKLAHLVTNKRMTSHATMMGEEEWFISGVKASRGKSNAHTLAEKNDCRTLTLCHTHRGHRSWPPMERG